MEIAYSKRFLKAYKKAPTDIKTAFKKRLSLFLNNPKNPLLENHSLQGELSGYHSINITGDWRAIYSLEKNNTLAFFIIIGTHSNLYK